MASHGSTAVGTCARGVKGTCFARSGSASKSRGERCSGGAIPGVYPRSLVTWMAMDSPVSVDASVAALVPTKRASASVVHLKGHWFIAATSRELRRKPLPTTLFGTPIVLFRDARGKAGALLDRCPHRNVPLSLGTIASDGTLACAYHGWRFDTQGACTFIPSLSDGSEAKARRAHALPTLEQQGFIWVYSSPSQDPAQLPDSE